MTHRIAYIRCFVSFLALFIVLDTFFILPDAVVVPVPGAFRLSDLLIPFVALVFILQINKAFELLVEHTQVFLIMVSSMFLFLMTALMASVFFNQEFLSGLIFMRSGFNYAAFFFLYILIHQKQDVKFLISLICIFTIFIAVLSLVQKLFPQLPIYNFRALGTMQYTGERYMRLGDFRLFFPHISFAVLAYFQFFTGLFKDDSFFMKTLRLVSIILIAYAIFLTGTRVHVFTLALVTVFALLTSGRKGMIVSGIAFAVLGASVQLLSMAISDKGLSAIENNRFSQLLMTVTDSEEGSISGRLFQHSMYMDHFIKSPLVGVGTLRYDPNLSGVYRTHGFYNNNDLGYSKIAAEYGLVGLAWIMWVFIYVFRKTSCVGKREFTAALVTDSGAAAKGAQLFFLYVLISGLTLPHFVEGYRIIPIIIALVIVEVTGREEAEPEPSTPGERWNQPFRTSLEEKT